MNNLLQFRNCETSEAGDAFIIAGIIDRVPSAYVRAVKFHY